MYKTFLGLLVSAFLAGAAGADSTSRIRIAGIVPASCDLPASSALLARNMSGTWVGETSYSCNSAHIVVVDVGPGLQGAEVIVGSVSARVGPDGTARLYRPQAHFGMTRLEIDSDAELAPQFHIILQPA